MPTGGSRDADSVTESYWSPSVNSKKWDQGQMGVVLAHKPFLQTLQKLDYYMSQGPPVPQQQLLSHWGAEVRLTWWEHWRQHWPEPFPDTVAGAQKDISEWEIPKGHQINCLLCRVLCRGRGLPPATSGQAGVVSRTLSWGRVQQVQELLHQRLPIAAPRLSCCGEAVVTER